MTDTDIVTWLRSIRHNDRSVEFHCQQAAYEIERLRKERDEARRESNRAHSILNEIDCRIQHGAESNGHLEAIYNLFKDNSTENA